MLCKSGISETWRIQNESKCDTDSRYTKKYTGISTPVSDVEVREFDFSPQKICENVGYRPVTLHARAFYVPAVWITYTGGSFSSKAVEAGALYTGRRVLAHVLAFACTLIATFRHFDRRF